MKVDIAIMTIRQDEFVAVRNHFTSTKRQRIPDGRTYLIGEVKTGEQTYTIAIARCTEQGVDPSQRLAHYIIQNLDPQLILVVGIAGGVPCDDFTLGDVVVSTRIVNPNVDAWYADGTTDYMTRGGPPHPLVEDIVSLLPGEPGLADWADSIHLKRPGLNPKQANIQGDNEWHEKVLQSLDRHFDEAENPGRSPTFTTGPILSSNHLMKDPVRLRNFLKTHRAVLAVDMETAGVYEAAQHIGHQYPVMAIRGISDIIGVQRDSQWTHYACQTAAAFTYAFVKIAPIDPRMNQQVELPQVREALSSSEKSDLLPTESQQSDNPAKQRQLDKPLDYEEKSTGAKAAVELLSESLTFEQTQDIPTKPLESSTSTSQKTISDRPPKTKAQWLDEGYAHWADKRYEEALAVFEQVLRLDPHDEGAWYYKGSALYHFKRYEEALAAYEQVIQLNPNYLVAYLAKGWVLYDLGRPQEAFVAYDQAIQHDPNYARAYNDKSVLLRESRHYFQALEALEQAIRLTPDYTYAYLNQGLVLDDLERYHEALAAFEQALQHDPDYARAHYEKGRILEKLGRSSEAQQAYEKARRLGYGN